ncbi:hypothetical protein [Paenibacillus taiwanensis]|uniref:hypothetical protein n=1 Tax=Paenibacillus taiwanensis TaxID=401638 RepID=UPI0006880E32|nr:hypothetical protein [Paenibacillus taiwanensis]
MAGEEKGKYYSHVEPKLLLIEAWARDGVIDEEIAKNLGIAYSTLRDYIKKHSALSAALKRGKEVVDVEVENALLKRALGYQYDEVTKELKTVIDEEKGPIDILVETKRVTKEVQPDTTAQIFWLKNRRPQAWRDKQEVGLSGGLNNTTQDLSDMTPDERRARIDELNRRRGIGAPAAT